MSTLSVSNISDGTTSVGTSYVVNGSAKAWVNFKGAGTITAQDSLNLSSLTDNGTGDYTVNFSNVFDAANYNFAQHAGVESSGNSLASFMQYGTARASGSIRIYGKAQSGSSTLTVDIQDADAQFTGDLA